jgi:alkanesulfonate monooxygenase SsuD/methylene tetrahydromethanopterin reductase-like flavin-dependent oxidoreductase (luciferase family)
MTQARGPLSPRREWFLFLPQYRQSMADVVARARVAETSGFDGIAFLDHLETPMALDQPLWEAMTTATWIAAKTDRLRISHLVLCDAFRHPAVLAKQAVTLAEASGGRFELGLGSGSMPAELAKFDITSDGGAARVTRLAHTLRALHEYWGDAATTERTQAPRPTHRIPILLAGKGPRMLELVREYADWWNLPATQIDQLLTLLPSVGSARASVQQMVAFVRRGADRVAVSELSQRRFGHLGAGRVCGDADELVTHFARLAAQGAQRFYVWFADFAPAASIEEFGHTVIGRFPNTVAAEATT